MQIFCPLFQVNSRITEEILWTYRWRIHQMWRTNTQASSLYWEIIRKCAAKRINSTVNRGGAGRNSADYFFFNFSRIWSSLSTCISLIFYLLFSSVFVCLWIVIFVLWLGGGFFLIFFWVAPKLNKKARCADCCSANPYFRLCRSKRGSTIGRSVQYFSKFTGMCRGNTCTSKYRVDVIHLYLPSNFRDHSLHCRSSLIFMQISIQYSSS